MVSALAGARQMVLGNHEEYLVVQTLQFFGPQFQVAFSQPTEGRHLRGQPVSSGLFVQRRNGLESAFGVLVGEWNRRPGIPPPGLRAATFVGGAPRGAGPLDSPLPLQVEESPAPPVSRVAPWTPAAVAPLFRCWDLAPGHPPPPCGGSGTVACVESATITGRYGGGAMGPSGRGMPVR